MSKYNKRNKTLKQRNKFNTALCDDKMTFQDCEMTILRQAIKENEKTRGKKIVSNEDVQKIIKVVETFIIKKKLVCSLNYLQNEFQHPILLINLFVVGVKSPWLRMLLHMGSLLCYLLFL